MLFFLWGMPGAGKSATAKFISKNLAIDHLDLDELFIKTFKTSITDFWNKNGEDEFRKKEAELLKTLDSSQWAIVSCGGGTPCFYDNHNWMNKIGITIYLDLDSEYLAHRIFSNLQKRPMFKNLDTFEKVKLKVEEVLNKRKIIYETAKYRIALKNSYPYDFYLVNDIIKNYHFGF